MKKLFASIFLLIGICFAQNKVIHAGSLLDVQSGKLIKNKSIVIHNNLIQGIENSNRDWNGYEEIDLKDKVILPGLIDMHVHIESETTKTSYGERFLNNPEDIALNAYRFGQKTINAGFTTVRDLGGTGANIALRNAINKGKLQGPRIYTARKSLAITGGHADPSNGMKVELQTHVHHTDGVCNGADECAEAVRWQVKNGADWIKITATGGVLSVAKDGDGPAFSIEEIKSIVKTAEDRGVFVAAHAHGKKGMMRAIEGGVKTIEHGTYMDEEVFALMKKHDAYYVPTITAGMGVADSAKMDGYFPEVVRPKAIRIGSQIINTFEKAHKAGVNVAFGTDAGVFRHGKNAKEFEFMVQAGMSPIDAIQSATLTNAMLLRNDKIGEIAAGKYADIIAVDENPLENIKTLQNVIFVMKDGEVVKKE